MIDSDALTQERAIADQREAAMRWARSLFPANAWLNDNARITEVVLVTLADTFAERADGHSHLLIAATGGAVPLAPDDDVQDRIRAAGPHHAPCDYCEAGPAPLAGLLPVAAPPQVVVLALCRRCVGLLDHKYPFLHLVLPTGAPDHPEGDL